MSTFMEMTETAAAAAADPSKHVNYNLGMVLGVDDFLQEFTYHHARDKWLARDLHGYGTVSGLKVSLETKEGSVRIVVSAGTAVNPEGELIRVCTAQCADLGKWLAAEKNKEVIDETAASPPSDLSVFVVLCDRSCETDPVLIPGEPCRDETEMTKASRIQDGFRLELRFTPPPQTEEDGIRDFVRFVKSSFELVHRESGGTTSEEFIEMLRLTLSPPSSPVQVEGNVCELMAAAFRYWVTELRPAVRPKTLASCCGSQSEAGADEADCLLLAELLVPVAKSGSGQWVIDSEEDIRIDESRRPVLTSVRFLQQWVACGTGGGTAVVQLEGDAAGPSDDNVVQGLQGRPVSSAAPANGNILQFSGTQWAPATLPPVILSGDATGAASSTTVARLQGRAVSAAQPQAGQFLRFVGGQWAPAPADPVTIPPVTLAGDVSGQATATVVQRLQQRPVAANPPAEFQVLMFRGATWRPDDIGDVAVTHPPSGGPFAILAAGIVRGDGSSRFPVYMDLKAGAAGNGLLLVTFNGYINPLRQAPPAHTYIIKALPVAPELLPMDVLFVRFQDDGFVLGVMRRSTPMPAQEIQNTEFMIEVSGFGKL